MESSCCVVCESGLAKSNMAAVRLIRWNKIRVSTILDDPYSEEMMEVKRCATGPEFRKLMKSAERVMNMKDDTHALAYHDGYGQCENLEFKFASPLEAKGNVKLGQVLEVIGKQNDEKELRGFLRECANETVKVVPDLSTSIAKFAGAFDSALYFSLALESYLVIGPLANGTCFEQKDLPYENNDKSSLMNRVGSVLLNENGYRTIIIDNIVGVGNKKEKQEIADPYEWIKFFEGYTTLVDKWLIIGMMVPEDDDNEGENPYSGCNGEQLKQMLNCFKDYPSVKAINFVGGQEATVEDV